VILEAKSMSLIFFIIWPVSLPVKWWKHFSGQLFPHNEQAIHYVKTNACIYNKTAKLIENLKIMV
jgi:hypothetical protein